MKHETFAVAVLIFLAIYAAWTLADRMGDPRCYLDEGRAGLVCAEHAPIVLPSDAPDLDRI